MLTAATTVNYNHIQMQGDCEVNAEEFFVNTSCHGMSSDDHGYYI